MSGIEFNAAGLLNGLTAYNDKVHKATELYAETAKDKMIAYAKPHAPWTDRTGLSRQTIDGTVVPQFASTKIELFGSTPQFKYLELCHDKVWAILWPTVNLMSPEIKKGWASFISR